MKSLSVVAGVSAALIGVALAAAPKPKIKPTVEFAKSWDAAVAEAKTLNLPLVIHNHGFYCPPCWGMHAALLQNDDYIKFASANTVEVLALGRLDEAVEKKDKADEAKLERYKAKVDGKDVELMVEWPNLTYDEIIALNSSPAGQYNHTGFVPYTCVVDPYDLKEMAKFEGGTGASAVVAAAADAKKQLEKEHGKGVARKDYQGFVKAEGESRRLTGEGDFGKAVAALDPYAKPAAQWPQELKARFDKARACAIEAAEAKLQEIESKSATDSVQAKKDLDKLTPKLAKTGLEAKAKELAQKLAAGS